MKNIDISLLILTFCCSGIMANAQSVRMEKVAPNVYRHISYLDAGNFGKVACNGMVVFDRGEAVIFDTPAEETDALLLITWIRDSLNCRIKAVVPMHFHADCLGSLATFHRLGIPSYAFERTIQLAKENKAEVPQNSFISQKKLKAGREKIIVSFEGEGHTKDNVVAYVPAEKVLFGGCLVKEMNATKGNLADANTSAWSQTIEKVQKKYPKTAIIIPGHGATGDQRLLEYTQNLFKPDAGS